MHSREELLGIRVPARGLPGYPGTSPGILESSARQDGCLTPQPPCHRNERGIRALTGEGKVELASANLSQLTQVQALAVSSLLKVVLLKIGLYYMLPVVAPGHCRIPRSANVGLNGRPNGAGPNICDLLGQAIVAGF